MNELKKNDVCSLYAFDGLFSVHQRYLAEIYYTSCVSVLGFI